MTRLFTFVTLSFTTTLTLAHLAAFHPAMYCLNGVSGNDLNNDAVVSPLFQRPFAEWWMHAFNKCDQRPPPAGRFLELPAGKKFTVEIASNQAKTTLSYDGKDTSEWPDGDDHPEGWNVPGCITQPNMHTQNESMAAGTAFAISYESDIKKVTPDNLVVFSVRYHTPWKRVTTYDVPALMPACPEGGCTCAWGWIPLGCGEPNMYMQPFRCKVTNVSQKPGVIGTPKPPKFCKGNPSGCTKGPKQMLYWNQLEGDNIKMPGHSGKGTDVEGLGLELAPGYNQDSGFPDGAQDDIFISAVNPPAVPSTESPPETDRGREGSTERGCPRTKLPTKVVVVLDESKNGTAPVARSLRVRLRHKPLVKTRFRRTWKTRL